MTQGDAEGIGEKVIAAWRASGATPGAQRMGRPMDETSPWWNSPALAALDLEGTGPQDPQGEAILEIAVVPVHEGRPVPSASHSTRINPGRPIQQRPWISPGLTHDVLSKAPSAQDVWPRLAALLDGKIIIGHNVRVDWRLLHRHYPPDHPRRAPGHPPPRPRPEPPREGPQPDRVA
ncbi:3'-5' exonuclease [Streptomyces sp. NPDC057654]|uniref:3'-5' exonuclease n=1 Tax=Streptomyces sp. NPDC057654 TaxID=3346196 RepID=UPI00367DC5F3